VEAPLGVWRFIPSHFPSLQGFLLACNLASPYLGHEPKARVTIVVVHCCYFVTFYLCLLMSSCYALLVFVIAFVLCFIGVCQCSFVVFYWCLLSSPCCVLLVLVVAPFFHSIDVCCGPLLHSICVCCHPSAAFYWCSSWPPCCTLLVFVITPLLCFFGVCWRPLATLYWCLLAPPCYTLLVLVGAPLLCSISTSLTYFTHQHSFVVFVDAFFSCSIGALWDSKLVFPCCIFFTSMQVWKFKLIS